MARQEAAPIWTQPIVEEPTWIQLYGNTQFAAVYGDDNNYDGFAQGLHPGIDFGAPVGTPVYAGTYGTVTCISCGAYAPGRIDIKRGGLKLLYGHLDNIQVQVGDWVTPKTILGYIDATERHVHVEVWKTLQENNSTAFYMTNPLPHFTDELQVQILDVAESQYQQNSNDLLVTFHCAGHISYWQSPYDQPDILRGGASKLPSC